MICHIHLLRDCEEVKSHLNWKIFCEERIQKLNVCVQKDEKLNQAMTSILKEILKIVDIFYVLLFSTQDKDSIMIFMDIIKYESSLFLFFILSIIIGLIIYHNSTVLMRGVSEACKV